MSDWFSEGETQLIQDIAKHSGVEQSLVEKVFSTIQYFDLVDYDLLKDVILDRYFDGGVDIDE